MTPGLRGLILCVIGLFVVTTSGYAGPYDIPADGDLTVEGRMEGRGHSVTYIYGGYSLTEGFLSKRNVWIRGAIFTQSGGTNIVHGDLALIPGWFQDRTSYTLTGGYLVTSNTSLARTDRGGFGHYGGVHIVRNVLSLDRNSYSLAAGLLTVKDIHVGADAQFSHSGGKLKHTGLLELAGGTWYPPVGGERLGPLAVLSGITNSTLYLRPKGLGAIRFADCSAVPWDGDAQLVIYNWRGPSPGQRGWTRIYFGTTSTGLTTQQLAQVIFRNPYAAPPGDYPARLRANGELLPTR